MGEVPKQLQPFVFKIGNKFGSRKKKNSMKEFARQFLLAMTDEEKIKFMNSLDPDIVWRMAEGNPAQDVTSGGEKIKQIPIYGGKSTETIYPNNSKRQDTGTKKTD